MTRVPARTSPATSDVQLGLFIARSLQRRAERDSSAAGTEHIRIKKVLRNTAIDGKDLPWARARYIEAEFGVGQSGPAAAESSG